MEDVHESLRGKLPRGSEEAAKLAQEEEEREPGLDEM